MTRNPPTLFPGSGRARAMIYIPVVASVVGSSLVWFWIYQQQKDPRALQFAEAAKEYGLIDQVITSRKDPQRR